MAHPEVSIIVCTRNRADSLRETLAALGRCVVPPDLTAELVVVDNGSTDSTAAVVRGAVLEHLPVCYVYEGQLGLARARNAGLREARGEVFLFTDDDVRPPVDWIVGMCRPLLLGEGDAVAGAVHFPAHYAALFEREPYRSRPGWFAATSNWHFEAQHLVGANMAFHRRVAEKLGGFDPELGAGASGFHEETLWGARLLAAGFRMVGAPGISVEHHFDRSRLNRRILLDMAARMGRSSAWLSYHWDEATAEVSRWEIVRTRWLLRLGRILTPWRLIRTAAPLWEMQRVQNLAYLEGLRDLCGRPRKYLAKA